jgi:hypothetical protein
MIEMDNDIDTVTATDTRYDVHDADAYTIATRDEYALVYAVDDNSTNDDTEFGVTTYYCHDNGDVYKASSETDDNPLARTAEDKAHNLQDMAGFNIYDAEAHYGAVFTMSPVRR